jgi:LmbE family N-acetylglucosaminyl deacetylase
MMDKWESETISRLVYRIRGLGMAAGVLHLGAHPDDEDIGLLAYLACKFGVRAVYWSATRGEGGQNRIGPYRDEALGIYRTWESLAARAVDQSECLFGPFYDFGYCKNAEVALAKWGKEALVREVVRAIRLVQPHIVVARWAGVPGDFHGHHQAVGLAALEAFEAAGDPRRFPELAEVGLPAWQPLKFYHSMDNSGGDQSAGGAVNVFGHRNPALERDGVVRLNTGEFDPVSGLTYQERAWLAYNQHQTQAMGLAPAPGDFYYYFSLHRSLVSVPAREESLFDGLDPTLAGLARYPGRGLPGLQEQLEAIQEKTREALNNFQAEDPLQASDSILAALGLLRETLDNLQKAGLADPASQALHLYLSRREGEMEEVVARTMGLELEVLSEKGRVIPGQTFALAANLWNPRRRPLKEVVFYLALPPQWEGRRLKESNAATVPVPADPRVSQGARFEVSVSEDAELSSPYWLVQPRGSCEYCWPAGEPCGRPFGPPPVAVQCRVDLGEQSISLSKSAVHRQAFPGGFRELPLVVIPPISLKPRTEKEFLRRQDAPQELLLHVIARNNGSQPVAGSLELVAPPGWQVNPGQTDLVLSTKESTQTLGHTVSVPPGAATGRYPLQYRMHCDQRDYGVLVTAVRAGAPGIPAQADASNCVKEEFIFTPSQVMVHLLEVEFVPGLRYAYVLGAEEKIASSLKPFGIQFHFIQDEEFGYLDLSAFNAVVVGPNAYLVREELRKYAGRFLEYVQQGGVLIVQYQGYRYQTQNFTPYPFKFSMPHDRVTSEVAPVKLLAPDHLLFRLPNAIGEEDFADWVHDRGLYFFGQWDRRYQPLLACADPGEDPCLGGLLECQYGRGTYIYTGYSFFRQLPAGAPGAFRLFANLLALPEARILERIDFLKKISLFSLLTPEQLDSVARIMSELWVEDGRYICRQGEVGDELYVVYRGAVEVVREYQGTEEVVFLAREGDSLGEMAVLGDIPRTASLRSRGGTELLVIEGSHFHHLLRQNPDMSIQMIKLLVNRFAPSG